MRFDSPASRVVPSSPEIGSPIVSISAAGTATCGANTRATAVMLNMYSAYPATFVAS